MALHIANNFIQMIFLLKFLFLKFQIGMERSTASIEIYENQEKRNVKLMKILLLWVVFVITSIYIPPFLCPIGYAIFGFPKPDQWYLPYPTS